MEDSARKRKASGQPVERKEKVSALQKISQIETLLNLSESDSDEDRNRTPSGNIVPNKGDIRGFFEKKQKGVNRPTITLKIVRRTALREQPTVTVTWLKLKRNQLRELN